MRAVVMEEYGAAGVLQPREVTAPPVPPGWVAVELSAAGLNRHDVLVREGAYPGPLPQVIGSDGVGHRRDTGEAVIVFPSLFWGDDEPAPGPAFEILGDRHWGTYAEVVVVPEECAVPRPTGLSDHEAATLALSGVTVYRALVSRGRLRSGEHVLVLGAGGGVATAAVSLAAAVGAHAVVTSSSRANIERALAQGAVAGVDRTSDDWVQAAIAATPGGRGFDLVLDSVGCWRDSLRCLRPGGRCVVLGASAHHTAQLDVRPYYFGQYELIGTTMGSPNDMRGLLRLLESTGGAPPVIDSAFGLDDASAAHLRLESGHSFGKVVLDVR